MPAGVYRVIVEASPPITFERVIVLPGEVTTLEATELGRLRVELLDDQGRHLRAPVSIRSGRRELRYAVTGEEAVMQAGSYDVSVDLGDSVLQQEEVAVAAGRTTRLAFGGGGTLLVLSPEFETLRRRSSSPSAAPTSTPCGSASRMRCRQGRTGWLSRRLVYVTEDVTVRDENQTVVTLPETGILGVSLGGADGVVADVDVDVREVLTERCTERF